MDLTAELLKLTDKQRAYVEARAAGAHPSAAAITAGYNAEHASVRAAENEKHPRIKLILQQTARDALQRISLSRQDVLEGLMDAVHAAATSTELTMAWREIGKVIGAYEPQKVDLTMTHKTAEQMETLGDKELLELAEQEGFTLDGDFEELPELEQAALEDLSGVVPDLPDRVLDA